MSASASERDAKDRRVRASGQLTRGPATCRAPRVTGCVPGLSVSAAACGEDDVVVLAPMPFTALRAGGEHVVGVGLRPGGVTEGDRVVAWLVGRVQVQVLALVGIGADHVRHEGV